MRSVSGLFFVSIAAVVSLPLTAAVSGTAINGTTGKPQAGLSITLVQASEKGMDPVGNATTNAAGEFSFAVDPPVTSPLLVQAVHQGVTYTKPIAPTQPRTGVALELFDSSSKGQGVGVDRHGILLEPTGDKLAVREFIFLNNTSKVTYVDPANGAYRFWAPDDAKIEVSVTAQGGMSVKRPAAKTGTANTWKIDYPVRPGQTQIEISYESPKADSFSGNVLHKEGETRLIVPRGLSLQGTGLEEFAPEPRTQSAIYGVKSGPFSVTIAGKAQAPEAPEENSGSPEVAPGRPRIYGKLNWILGIMAAILGIGLYSLAKSK